jgi:hypothetical protein
MLNEMRSEINRNLCVCVHSSRFVRVFYVLSAQTEETKLPFASCPLLVCSQIRACALTVWSDKNIGKFTPGNHRSFILRKHLNRSTQELQHNFGDQITEVKSNNRLCHDCIFNVQKRVRISLWPSNEDSHFFAFLGKCLLKFQGKETEVCHQEYM